MPKYLACSGCIDISWYAPRKSVFHSRRSSHLVDGLRPTSALKYSSIIITTDSMVGNSISPHQLSASSFASAQFNGVPSQKDISPMLLPEAFPFLGIQEAFPR